MLKPSNSSFQAMVLNDGAEEKIQVVAEVVEDIRVYQRLGVTHFVWDLTASDLKGALALLERFARDVRPKVQRLPR